jgi:hypothetical protein
MSGGDALIQILKCIRVEHRLGNGSLVSGLVYWEAFATMRIQRSDRPSCPRAIRRDVKHGPRDSGEDFKCRGLAT